jgi:hypothetical protein
MQILVMPTFNIPGATPQTVRDNDALFGGPEERKRLEKKLLRKIDARMSILIVIYILNYVSLSVSWMVVRFGGNGEYSELTNVNSLTFSHRLTGIMPLPPGFVGSRKT